jgi:hypothetical protein
MVVASWRDDATPEAQNDMDSLLEAVLPFAQQMLDQHGEFFPFGARVSVDGELVMLATDAVAEHPPSQDVLDELLNVARAVARDSRAACFTSDVLVDGGDAIRVEIEHRDGHAIVVLLPYEMVRPGPGVVYGDLMAAPGVPRVW